MALTWLVLSSVGSSASRCRNAFLRPLSSITTRWYSEDALPAAFNALLTFFTNPGGEGLEVSFGCDIYVRGWDVKLSYCGDEVSNRETDPSMNDILQKWKSSGFCPRHVCILPGKAGLWLRKLLQSTWLRHHMLTLKPCCQSECM